MMRIVRGVLVATSFALLTACAVGPNYKRPTMDLSAAYKEQDGWKPSEPNDALDRGKWWEIYHDEVLTASRSRSTSPTRPCWRRQPTWRKPARL